MGSDRGDAELGVAIVGAGQMGYRHAEAVSAAPGLSVRLVVDIDRKRAGALAAVHDAESSGDVAAWKSHGDIDVVYVCVPAAYHQDIAVPALEAGKHVFCEKPLALRLEDGTAIAEASSRASGVFAVNFQHRQRDPVRRLRSLFSPAAISGRFYGSIVSIASVRPNPAMHDPGLNGGPMIDNLCHFTDMIRFITGAEPTSVTATGSVLAAGKPELARVKEPAVDSALVQIEFGSSGAVQVMMSWGLPKGIPGTNTIVLIDERRKAVYDFPTELKLSGVEDPSSIETVTDTSNPLKAQAVAFSRAVAVEESPAVNEKLPIPGGGVSSSDETPVLAGVSDGLRALAVGDAVLRSIDTGIRIEL